MAKKKTKTTKPRLSAAERLLQKKATAFDMIASIVYPTVTMLREDYDDDNNGGTDGPQPSDQDLLDWFEWDNDHIEMVAEEVLRVYPKAYKGTWALK